MTDNDLYEVVLQMTCGACPEQYDAYINGVKVAYLRLRHGYFYVQMPYDSENKIYEAYPVGDGSFEEWEREDYLNMAKLKILEFLVKFPALVQQLRN